MDETSPVGNLFFLQFVRDFHSVVKTSTRFGENLIIEAKCKDMRDIVFNVQLQKHQKNIEWDYTWSNQQIVTYSKTLANSIW